MDLERTRACVQLATDSAREQIELSKSSLDNNLDASDRIILRKAAETTIELAKIPDPQ